MIWLSGQNRAGNNAPTADPIFEKPPKLVLQITIDQLRGDLPRRYLDRMSNGGFRYLLNQGRMRGSTLSGRPGLQSLFE